MLNFFDAQSKLLSYCDAWLKKQTPSTQTVLLFDALGCTLAEDIIACVDYPYEDVSAMDGYALRFCDAQTSANTGESFSVLGESRAGHPFDQSMAAQSCIAINTGAAVPADADTVVMVENTESEDGVVTLSKSTAANKNIRRRGEEIQIGDCLFKAGQTITPPMMSVLASQGIHELSIFAPLKIAVMSCGDELLEATSELSSGKTYESNSPTIASLLRYLPVDVTQLGIIEDNPNSIKAVLNQAAQTHDIVISSGGVSVGQHDYLKQCVSELGELAHYKVAMKPGKPICFGTIFSDENDSQDSCLYFGLPGNPVSAFVTLQMFFMPAMLNLSRLEQMKPRLLIDATVEHDIYKRAGRMEFQRGILTQKTDTDGNVTWSVRSCNSQDSHRSYLLAQANCYMLLEQDVDAIKANNKVQVSPFLWSFQV